MPIASCVENTDTCWPILFLLFFSMAASERQVISVLQVCRPGWHTVGASWTLLDSPLWHPGKRQSWGAEQLGPRPTLLPHSLPWQQNRSQSQLPFIFPKFFSSLISSSSTQSTFPLPLALSNHVNTCWTPFNTHKYKGACVQFPLYFFLTRSPTSMCASRFSHSATLLKAHPRWRFASKYFLLMNAWCHNLFNRMSLLSIQFISRIFFPLC